jgi:hypothetical protein
MQIPQPEVSLRPEDAWKDANPQFQKQLEDGLNDLKADVTERPFIWLGIAFIIGFLSHTFPIRLLFIAVLRLVTWLSGPLLLLMGIIKISDLISSSRR